MQKQTEKILNQLIRKSKTKDGETLTLGTTIDKLSAISLYYMCDKNSWQLKMWFYPTNKSKTYNVPLTYEQVTKLLPIINTIGLVNDDIFGDLDE